MLQKPLLFEIPLKFLMILTKPLGCAKMGYIFIKAIYKLIKM